MSVIVKSVIFRNEENGYTVLSFEDKGAVSTAVGNIPFKVGKGQELEVKGQWTTHPKYGSQLKITGIQPVEPVTEDAIKAYLSSGIIPGIGPATAGKIVMEFGEDSLKVLDDDPSLLLKIKGISDKKLRKISAAWKENRGSARVMADLCALGISAAYAARIYRLYGDSAAAAVKENPYKLADEVWGIGFLKADEIAAAMGFEKNHPHRVASGILYVIKEAMKNGHCYLPEPDLRKESLKLLDVEEGFFSEGVSELIESKKLISVPSGFFSGLRLFYLPAVYHAERYVEKRIGDLARRDVSGRISVRPPASVKGIELTFDQRDAAAVAVSSGMCIITGAAGTGKTTVIMAAIECLERNNLRYKLCAPTGKAAKRISEVAGREAKTIHRLLEVDRSGEFKVNDKNPLDADCVIVDEFSMVDVFLAMSLLKAVPGTCSLILVGDANQLPPVGPGNVFRDIISSEACLVMKLEKIQRQQEGSGIIRVADEIRRGIVPSISNNASPGVFLLKAEDVKDASRIIVDAVMKAVPEKLGIKPEDIQVLSPMKKGDIGTDNINRLLQNALIPGPAAEVRGFRLNDKVMQIRNNYGKDVFNGDIGRVAEMDAEDDSLTVVFDGRAVEYEGVEIDEELMLSYCCTVHKYQGSEARCVIMPVHTSHYIMLRRDILYTGATRAKDCLIIVGSGKAVAIGTKNNAEQKRNTGLFRFF